MEKEFNLQDDLQSAEPTQEQLNELHEEAVGNTSTDEETGEVTTIVTKPTLKTSDKGTYKGLFLAPINHLQRIKDALTEMAETDAELADAIANGKKTFEGCDRYIRNNMADLARAMGTKEITFDDATVHLIARYYMVNPDNLDVQNVAQAVKKEKAKKEPKPKAEKKSKVVPLTPQMGSLFSDEDFD